MPDIPVLSPDQTDALSEFCGANVEFLIVGAHALAAHGTPRATGDLDIFVRPSSANALKVWAALRKFGALLTDVTVEDFENPDVVFQIGLPPNRVDIITGISGVAFERAWKNRVELDLDGLRVSFIGCDDLMVNKAASGRPKDLLDLERLRRLRETVETTKPSPAKRRRR